MADVFNKGWHNSKIAFFRAIGLLLLLLKL